MAIYVPPVPASRPRVTRWGVYYGKTYKNYREEMDKALPPSARPPLEGPLAVDVTFYIQKPKTTKRHWPRGDIDNYVKAILDAINGKGYWVDDDQVVTLNADKIWVLETPPRTEISIIRLPL